MVPVHAVNFRDLKAAISIEALMAYHRINLPEQKGDERRGNCPLPGCNSKRGFTINVAKNVFRCHTCRRGGDIIDFVKAKEGLATLKEAGNLLARTFEVGECAKDFQPSSTEERGLSEEVGGEENSHAELDAAITATEHEIGKLQASLREQEWLLKFLREARSSHRW